MDPAALKYPRLLLLVSAMLAIAIGARALPASAATAGQAFPHHAAQRLASGSTPVVTGVFPPAGPAIGGTTVVIAGSGFSTAAGAATVSFGGVAATAVTCESATQCTALSPAGTGGAGADVTVTVASQTSAISSADLFSYGNPCPGGSWVGLPYLNRFFTGDTSSNGVNGCAFSVGGTTFPGSNGVPASLEIPPGLTAFMEAAITVASGGTLSLDAGVTLQVSCCALTVNSGGAFSVNGTQSSMATITSANATPAAGDWGPIVFSAGSSGSLNFAKILFSGASFFYGCNSCVISAGIVVNGSQPTVTNTTIDHSAGNDVFVLNGGLPVLHHDVFGAVPSGGASFGVTNSGWQPGQPQVDATYDDWGDSSGPSGAYTGSGAPVSTGVFFDPWLNQSGARLSGTVFDGTVSPRVAIPNAAVQVCASASHGCRVVLTDASGLFSLGGLGQGQYQLQVNPPAGRSLFFAALASATIPPGTASVTQDIIVTVPAHPLPNAYGSTNLLGFDGTGIPIFQVGAPFVVCYPTCPANVLAQQAPSAARAAPRDSLPPPPPPSTTAPSNQSYGYRPEVGGKPSGDFVNADEVPNGDGTSKYVAHVPALGEGDCVIVFVDFITHNEIARVPCHSDPSGAVRTPGGQPVIGATVTLLRSDTPSGPFTVVPDGSAIMSPSNQRNPDTTGNGGIFHWDVLSGYYKIQASAAGCANTGATGILPVPPPQDGLVVTLDCPSGTPGPTLTSAEPFFGSAHGGTSITINGSNFQSGATVALNGQPATSTSISADGKSVVARTPAHSPVGDVNGTGAVDSTDALCVLRSVAQLAATPACPASTVRSWGDVSVTNPDGRSVTLYDGYIYDNLDVNGDGLDNATDALCILRHVAQLTGTAACPAFGAAGPHTAGSLAASPEANAASTSVATTIVAEPAAIKVEAGAETALSIHAQSGGAVLGAWTVDVQYDPQALTLVDCTPAGGSACNTAFAAGVVRIVGASASGLPAGQPLATLHFKANGHGKRPVPLTVAVKMLADVSGAPLPQADIGDTIGVTPTPTPAPSPPPDRRRGS